MEAKRSKPTQDGGHIPLSGILLAARSAIDMKSMVVKNPLGLREWNPLVYSCFEHLSGMYSVRPMWSTLKMVGFGVALLGLNLSRRNRER